MCLLSTTRFAPHGRMGSNTSCMRACANTTLNALATLQADTFLIHVHQHPNLHVSAWHGNYWFGRPSVLGVTTRGLTWESRMSAPRCGRLYGYVCGARSVQVLGVCILHSAVALCWYGPSRTAGTSADAAGPGSC